MVSISVFLCLSPKRPAKGPPSYLSPRGELTDTPCRSGEDAVGSTAPGRTALRTFLLQAQAEADAPQCAGQSAST